MDPATISLIAAGTVSVLVPYFTKAGEKFSEAIGEKLANMLTKKFEGQPEAKEALDKLKEVPDSPTLQKTLQAQVEKAIAADDAFAQTLQTLIAEVKPTVGGDHIEIDVQASGYSQVGDITGKIVGSRDEGT
jgi:Tfp pilus assembly protein PilN